MVIFAGRWYLLLTGSNIETKQCGLPYATYILHSKRGGDFESSRVWTTKGVCGGTLVQTFSPRYGRGIPPGTYNHDWFCGAELSAHAVKQSQIKYKSRSRDHVSTSNRCAMLYEGNFCSDCAVFPECSPITTGLIRFRRPELGCKSKYSRGQM